MKKILIVEDEPGLALAIEDRLINEEYKTETCGDGILAEKLAKENNFDLILLDVMLPGRDGFQICRNLRSFGIKTPIIMLTARNTTIDKVMGLQTGADDYLTKPFDFQELLARVESQLRRQAMGSSQGLNEDNEEYSFDHFVLNTHKQTLYKDDEIIELNSGEYRLLKFLLKNSNRIITREEFLDEVWGYDSVTTTRTIDVHISRLRKKLGDVYGSQKLLTIRGRGYKLIVD